MNVQKGGSRAAFFRIGRSAANQKPTRKRPGQFPAFVVTRSIGAAAHHRRADRCND
jgi:hypothetical protein